MKREQLVKKIGNDISIKGLEDNLRWLLDDDLSLDDRIQRVEYICDIYDAPLIKHFRAYNSHKPANKLFIDEHERIYNGILNKMTYYITVDEDLKPLNSESSEKNLQGDGRHISLTQALMGYFDQDGRYVGDKIEVGYPSYTNEELINLIDNDDVIDKYVGSLMLLRNKYNYLIKEAEKELKAGSPVKTAIISYQDKNYPIDKKKLEVMIESGGWNGKSCISYDMTINSTLTAIFNPPPVMVNPNNKEISKKLNYNENRTLNKLEFENFGYTIDMSDIKDMEMLIKTSCLTDYSSEFDKYIEHLDRLAHSGELTDRQLELYSIYRNGRDTGMYEKKIVSNQEISNILDVSPSTVTRNTRKLAEIMVRAYLLDLDKYYYNEVIEGNLIKCTKCKTKKPANTNHFHRDSKGKFGLKSICKECI